MKRWREGLLAIALLASVSHFAHARPQVPLSLPGPTGWADAGNAPLRGITFGPIENARHPGRGYGSPAFQRALEEAVRLGATWVSLTPYGRVMDLKPTGVDLTFEAPFVQNRRDMLQAVAQAHAAGLKVLLVPHVWVESGGWHAEIDPGDDAGWKRFAASYQHFLLEWARVAEESDVDLLSVGVEQRSWVTTTRAVLYHDVLQAVRGVYHGPITYSGNWDDVETTVILGDLDVIGINAFYRLTEHRGASFADLLAGGQRVAQKVHTLAERWGKPVVFTEVGYTTRADTAYDPWEWPDTMANVRIDQQAQAEAYAALLAPMLEDPAFFGFFVWRYYADPDDVSQEAEWGFSPRRKRAEAVVRDAFHTHWAADGPRWPGSMFGAGVPSGQW